jgi:site-specific DNA-methyltransferase (adenine-specific)
MRREIIGDATLYLGDARELLAAMAERGERADLLLTDAPYLVTSGGSGSHKRAGWMADYDNGGSPVACDIEWGDWLPLIGPALVEQAHAYLFTDDGNLGAVLGAAQAAGLKLHTLLVWDKRSALPNRWYQQTCEFVLFMRQGKAFRINDCSSKSLASIHQKDESPHPTEKPAQLCEFYIRNSTQAGGLVLDPFLGSGTTAVAAVRAGRRFIGSEIEARWFDVACRRVEAALRQPGLFGAACDMGSSA